MSSSINLSSDLNNYLKKSGSSIGSSSAASSSTNAGGSGDGFLITGWFSGPSTTSGLGGGGSSSTSRQWFAYKPLSTKDDDKEGLISGTSEEGPGTSKSSWLPNMFGSKEPEPKGWLPSLVCLGF